MIAGLDHVGLVVRDLDKAAHFAAALGFNLTPRAALTRPGPGGVQEPSGAENQCLMFESGYIELLGIVDASRGHMIVPYLARREGVHILVLEAADVDGVVAAARGRGVPLAPAQTWERDVATAEGARRARFRFTALKQDETPEAFVGVVQHLTPDVIRPPGSTDHKNGAARLVECIVASDNPGATARQYGQLGLDVVAGGAVGANGSMIRIEDPRSLARRFPGTDLPAAPAVVGITIAVRRLPALKDRLAERFGAVGADKDAIWIDPKIGFGALWRFIEDPSP